MKEDERRGRKSDHHVFGIDDNLKQVLLSIFSSDNKQLNRIERKVDKILKWVNLQKRLKQAVGFKFLIIKPDGTKILKENEFVMAFRKNQEFTVTLKPVDVNGEPTTLDGDPTWESSDTSIATVTPNPENPLQATVRTSAENTGSAVITAKGDGDLDEGEGEVTEVVGTGLVTVLGNDAVGLQLEFGPATDIPGEEQPTE